MKYYVSRFVIPYSGKLFSGKHYAHIFLYCESGTYYEFFSHTLLGREVQLYDTYIVGHDGAFESNLDSFDPVSKAEFSIRIQDDLKGYDEQTLKKIGVRWLNGIIDTGRKKIEEERAQKCRERQAEQDAEDWFDSHFYQHPVLQSHIVSACPKCGQRYRVPKEKGTVKITCRVCKNVWITKT